MKMRSLFVLSLFLISCSEEAGPGTEETLTPEHQAIKELYSSELDCSEGSKDLERTWCPVTLVGDFELILPEEETTYLGLSVIISVPMNVNESSTLDFDTTHFTVLHLGPDEAELTTVIPENDQESKDILYAIGYVASLLKMDVSEENPPQISSDLWEYLLGEQAKLGHPLSVDTMSASFEGNLPATLYYVKGEPYGAAYVVFEKASEEGDAPASYYVSIFPVAEWTAK